VNDGSSHYSAPPRFQTLPRERWRSVFSRPEAPHLATTRLVAALRLRCRMPDCPGDLGCVIAEEFDPAWPPTYSYLAPPGFTHGDRPPRGFTPRPGWRPEPEVHFRVPRRARPSQAHAAVQDHQGALSAWAMPGTTWGLDDGRPVYIGCPVCTRRVRIDKALVQEVFRERCGLTSAIAPG
jgi:hypothetical protein